MTEQSSQRLAVITGGNRGIGFEVCRQLAKLHYRVLLTSRDPAKGQHAAQALRAEGLAIYFHPLDVANEDSVRRVSAYVRSEFGRIDVLVNNAAIYPDEGCDVLGVELGMFRTTLETNLYGPLMLSQAFAPLMLQKEYGRIVNVSSGMGQLSDLRSESPAYRMSKVGLNALTLMLADNVKGSNVLVNAACPGWVRTDMGGAEAPRSVEEGADTIVWLSTLPDSGPSGGLFRERQAISW